MANTLWCGSTQISGTAVEELKSIRANLYHDSIPFKFGVDSSGKYGYYKDGESVVTPFSSPFDAKLFENVIIPFYIFTNSVGIRQNQSEVFCISSANKFKIVTQSVSNYTNYKLYASKNENMTGYVTLSSGQFGAAGTETVINNPDGYSYFKFEVGPGSSQYLSYVKFQVRA